MTSDPILAKQAALPPVIRLFRYQPARRVSDITAFDPARVGAAADLPPYLVLGALDEASFQLGREGWSANYRGTHPETELRISYVLPQGLYRLHQSWRGIAGGSAGADGRLSLDRVLSQFLYPGFPTGWDEAAAATLRREVQVHYVAQQEALPSFWGFPDGAMRTVAFPVAVGDLRSMRARIAAVAAQRPDYPIAAEARLVSQTVYVDERAFAPMGSFNTKAILERSEKQTGMPPSDRSPSRSRRTTSRSVRSRAASTS